MAERRKVIFPIIGDDEVLQRDTRVIYTNQQLIYHNPSLRDEASASEMQAPKTNKKPDNYKPYKPTVSYSSQHRPLSGNHSGVSSFDKMPKRTSVDESKARAKRAAATLPKPVKKYVSPLERTKEDFAARRTSSHTSLVKRPLTNDNPIQDMKKRGMNLEDALSNSGQEMRKAVPHNQVSTGDMPQKKDYFENKRKNIFDRGII